MLLWWTSYTACGCSEIHTSKFQNRYSCLALVIVQKTKYPYFYQHSCASMDIHDFAKVQMYIYVEPLMSKTQTLILSYVKKKKENICYTNVLNTLKS